MLNTFFPAALYFYTKNDFLLLKLLSLFCRQTFLGAVARTPCYFANAIHRCWFWQRSIWLEFSTVKRFLGHRVLACDFVFPLYIKVCLVNAILQWFYDLFCFYWCEFVFWCVPLPCYRMFFLHTFFAKPFVRVRIVNVTYRKQFYDVLILHFLSLWLDACFMFVFFITNLCRSLLYNCASLFLTIAKFALCFPTDFFFQQKRLNGWCMQTENSCETILSVSWIGYRFWEFLYMTAFGLDRATPQRFFFRW